MLFSQPLKRLLRRFGVDARRYNVSQSEPYRLLTMLGSNGIDLVLDVGANRGQYGSLLREHGYRGGIISFEPLPDAYDDLRRRAAHDPAWHVAPRTAVGDSDGDTVINVSGNSTSSSLLDMHQEHQRAAPASTYLGKHPTPICRLDSFEHPALTASQLPFLKIDTQGYEAQTLRGASALLERIKGVQVEMSLVPLYDGQALYCEIHQTLAARGFKLWGVFPGFQDPASGRLLQLDGVFFR